jgi:hypothetical protein
MHPPRDALGELQDLREEVEDLRAEVRRLRRGLSELRALVVEQQGTTSGRDSAGLGSYTSASFSPSPDRTVGIATAAPAVVQSVPEQVELGLGPSAHTTLTWQQREEICDQIGRFLARSIAGAHRGSSGRERINLPSRLWIIVRDFSGQIYTPVKVVRSWSSCKVLCKPSNNECGDSVFVGVPLEREARRVVAAAQLEWPGAVEA